MAPSKQIYKFPSVAILKKAIEDIKSKRLSYRAASRIYGIPRSTLLDKLQGR